MKTQQEQLETINEIRSLMERSSRFLYLSGLAGIFVGILALLGVTALYLFTGISPINSDYSLILDNSLNSYNVSLFTVVIEIAIIVLILSIIAGSVMAIKNARKHNQPLWDQTAKRLVLNLFIPLVAGGIYAIILMINKNIDLVAPTTLLFYGIALVNASKYAVDNLRLLGILNIVLGLLGSLFTEYGILFWGFGFGLLHIVYGIVIYFKYEK